MRPRKKPYRCTARKGRYAGYRVRFIGWDYNNEEEEMAIQLETWSRRLSPALYRQAVVQEPFQRPFFISTLPDGPGHSWVKSYVDHKKSENDRNEMAKGNWIVFDTPDENEI